MNENKRIAYNIVYIYVSIILCTIFSLVTVPVLLQKLGASDYGIYNLVAGVITMLSFFKGSMVIAIQRFMNVAYGKKDLLKVNRIFTVGLILFLIVAIIISIIIELFRPFISDGYLNISTERISAATLLFQVLVVNTFFTTIGVPYDALFNVHEDMGLFSIFNTIDALLRLLLAFSIGFMPSIDNLVYYGLSLAIISVIIFIIKYKTCKCKYPNIKIIRLCKNDILIFKDILSFIGWNLYSAMAKIFSTQGYAVVLNHFMGTKINAAYGIANQINGALTSLTASIDKAFNPQIMKSEGMKDDNRMIKLSLLSTKYSSMIYSLISIPFLAALPFILKLWLKTPPEFTKEFSEIIIIASIVSMLSLGLAPMLYAKGTIKQYLFSVGTILILVVFAASAVLKLGMSVIFAVSLLIILECILFIIRLYYCKKLAGLVYKDYFKLIFIPYFKAAIPSFLLVIFFQGDTLFNVILVCILSSVIYCTLIYYFSLTKEEQLIVGKLLDKVKFG